MTKDDAQWIRLSVCGFSKEPEAEPEAVMFTEMAASWPFQRFK